ncbi:MAG TPA: cadmium-translocating P-type ATPase [Clostridia bacterium]|nr:cadmium-translocating P-type ATPase [Clostridia bacterium]
MGLWLGIIIYFFTLIFTPNWAGILFFISYLLIGGEIVYLAFRNIFRGRIFDENFLMTLATLGALAIKVYPEAVAVMLFYRVGDAIQHRAVDHSRRSIEALLEIKPDYAHLQKGEQLIKVRPAEVQVGDLVVVKPGEKIPLDGRVVEGISYVDTAALTGESVERRVQPGEEVLSGFLNTSGVLLIEVLKEEAQSTISKILELVEHAGDKKAPTEQFITKFARFYTPVVVGIALLVVLVPPLIFSGSGYALWFYRALVFLVISCPCALVISIPLGYFGGIGGASRQGILVKGGNYLDGLNNVETVVVDKTGTITEGVFEVVALEPEPGISKEELLQFAVWAETFSNHPIAQSILRYAGECVVPQKIERSEEIIGRGMEVKVGGQTILAGSKVLLTERGIEVRETEAVGTVVYLAVEGKFIGKIIIADKLKKDSRVMVKGLRKWGVKQIVMLSGDREAVVAEVAAELALDNYYAELLPQEKVAKLEELLRRKSKGNLVFVGDGINDAPVLARADIGVAMGALGSDAAIEAADVVIMNDQPAKLVTALQIARRTRRIVRENIVLALTVKIGVLLLGGLGIASMWEAVFADVGVALLAILNATRIIRMEGFA